MISDIFAHPSFRHIAALFFFTGFASTIFGPGKPQLARALARGFTAGNIPTGILLVCAAFQPSLLIEIEDLSIYIGAAGAIVLWLASDELFISHGLFG